MPYLLKIGAIPENLSKKGSRGYHTFRRGSVVVIEFGPVEVKKGATFVWAQTPQRKQCSCKSVVSAREFHASQISTKCRTGYSLLPKGVYIGKSTG